MGGYLNWLFGGGKPQTIKADSIRWTLLDTSKLEPYAGKGFASIKSGAIATGFNEFEHIGRVGGVFNGTVTKTSNGFSAEGTFTPWTDQYDFDNKGGRGFLGDAATQLGGVSGTVLNHGSLGIIKPTNYPIYFEGSSATIIQTW